MAETLDQSWQEVLGESVVWTPPLKQKPSQSTGILLLRQAINQGSGPFHSRLSCATSTSWEVGEMGCGSALWET